MVYKCVVLGDSLAMPRCSEGIAYEDTYPHLVFKLNRSYEVINRSRRANDSSIQLIYQNLLDDITYIKPDIVVLHLGIVDCAPRIFSRLERKVVSRLPVVGKYIIQLFSNRRHFVTKLRRRTYVNLDCYKDNINCIINTINNSGAKIIIIKIKNTNKYNESRSYGFKENIKSYNSILDRFADRYGIQVVDPNNFRGGLLPDGIHIDAQLHKYIASRIINILTPSPHGNSGFAGTSEEIE